MREISFFSSTPDNSIRNLSGFDRIVKDERFKLSHKPVDILSFDNTFLENDIVHGTTFKGKRPGLIVQNFTNDVDLGSN